MSVPCSPPAVDLTTVSKPDRRRNRRSKTCIWSQKRIAPTRHDTTSCALSLFYSPALRMATYISSFYFLLPCLRLTANDPPPKAATSVQETRPGLPPVSRVVSTSYPPTIAGGDSRSGVRQQPGSRCKGWWGCSERVSTGSSAAPRCWTAAKFLCPSRRSSTVRCVRPAG